MRRWHEEYRRTGKITSILDIQEDEAEGEAEAETENECPDYESSEETVPEPEAFKPWYGYPSGNEEDSFENIKREFEPSARRLLEAFALTDPEEFRRLAFPLGLASE
jgi:hypothetical protein